MLAFACGAVHVFAPACLIRRYVYAAGFVASARAAAFVHVADV